MNITRKFAVVDLETTGTNKDEDRIIQFGCTLIDDGKIGESISILINPEQPINKRITELTGISNEMVADAPKFEEVASKIYQCLKGRTFVAHNVNFDYPFIKDALNSIKSLDFDAPAVDTVELSQILLPQLSSYKLQDISEYLNISHDHPHRADDDALVTAKLLLILIQRIEMLPLTTLRNICEISESTIRQTSLLFKNIYQSREQHAEILSDYLYEKHGLILRKKQIEVSSNQTKKRHFPNSESEKRSAFLGTLDFRQQQAQLMNDINHILNHSKKQKWSLLEAPTGIGKTIGYLYPLTFKISLDKKVVVATTTTVLQNQIQDEAIPLLNRLSDYSFNVQIIKSSYNYLDLDRFYNALYQNLHGHKNTSILKMKILVWLTMTTTGDMDELRLSNRKNPFLALISHRGEDKTNTNFSEDDFWKFNLDKARNAEILITNQAYFSKNLDSKIWSNAEYLVIDEAHHFAQNLRSNNSPEMNIATISNEVKKISDTFYQNRTDLKSTFNDDYLLNWGRENLSELESLFQNYQQSSEAINSYVYDNYFKEKSSINNQPYSSEQFLNQDLKEQNKLVDLLSNIKDNLSDIIIKVDELVGAYFAQENFSGVKISSIVMNLSMYNNNLRNQVFNTSDLITKITSSEISGIGLQVNNGSPLHNCIISWYKLDTNTELQQINSAFKKILLVSGAIDNNDNFSFFINDLQLKSKYIDQRHIYQNDFDIKQNAKIYIPNDTQDIKSMNDDAYSGYLSEMLEKFLIDNDHQALVLFNSLQTMQSVYQKLSTSTLNDQKEILAQGINGNNEKIKKRFSNSKNSVLLGSNSFWEGVDFPKKILEIVIITRLPFDSPDQNETMIRSKYLTSLNINAFSADALPRASLKLKQGFGRLIRTKNDRGVMIILDDRIIKTKYGKNMLAEFPEEIIDKQLSSQEIKKNLEEFLE
ncbi:helicase C-terminal domain-containing protein [Lactobacillus sp. YT155]|uniref:helicase C-terminal domain-containing protein n=1 Tax=Lactobacillus sp. YT155 TaxID=3060955 RepID=UPI00265DE674|nr:helicase C-terminal domain-containing protein [Lactobacillus sp. YT155]MDO1605439.1 helicase C-terminal domain-containing protein [Lactobacillus sp. YT155]